MSNIYTDGTYAEANPTWHQEDSPWKAGQILRLFKKHRLEPKSVAEIGCGAGGILRCLHDAIQSQTEFHGYDIASAPLELAKKAATDRLQFHNEDLLAAPATFDLLLVIDVIEHVPDYLGFLTRCRQKATLKIYHIPLEIHVSSTLRGTVAGARKSVGHIHYFTAETALACLQDTGHRIVDVLYTPGALGLVRFHPRLKSRLANIPRRAVGLFSEKFSQRLFGGYSLLVLAE